MIFEIFQRIRKVSNKMAYVPDFTKKDCHKVEYMTEAKFAESQIRYTCYLSLVTKKNDALYEEYCKNYEEWHAFQTKLERFATGLPVYPSYSAFSPIEIVSLEYWYSLSEFQQNEFIKHLA